MTTNITAVQTQIVEDAADTEDNNINRVIGQKVCVTNLNKLENL